ncbi:MAG: T9SS type B sorting domain-containing protein [Polaribacter sp.]|nr:T9SS type B sorting domain-containing protein [Polaribacter sp.]
MFFTPNNDGDNDFWGIKDFPSASYEIYIYDRFGNFIIKLNQNQLWDGTKNGVTINSRDLWFKLVATNGEVLFGNFSIINN